MTKQAKKSPVKPELRRQWLRRYEEEGESPPQIARADGYDVRTVRKQIDVERQERENREARSVVLRHALEQHYADLCAFAQKLDSQLTSRSTTLSTLKEDRMWSALREHLPRSVVWKSLARWERIQEDIGELQSEMEKAFSEQFQASSSSKLGPSSWKEGATEGVVAALSFHCMLLARGQEGILSRADFKLSPVGEQLTGFGLGAFHMGTVPTEQVADIQQLVQELLAEVTNWSEYPELERLLGELDRVQRVLRDELAVIILRRVVPGRCKYCPL